MGAKKILWIAENEDSIWGTVIYSRGDPDEKQDFVWHMTENNVPNDNIVDLLTYLTSKNLIYNDHITVPIEEIDIPGMDKETMNTLFNELFGVVVNMIDNGEETDIFFMHDSEEE